jgi:hypothetical protein
MFRKERRKEKVAMLRMTLLSEAHNEHICLSSMKKGICQQTSLHQMKNSSLYLQTVGLQQLSALSADSRPTCSKQIQVFFP